MHDAELDPDLVALGWDSGWDQARLAAGVEGARPARVVRAERGAAHVDDGSGDRIVSTGHLVDATTGDWVLLDAEGVPRLLLPRRTCVRRAEASGRSREQVLAANVDVVGVVVSLALDPDVGRLERLVSLAWVSGAVPMVLLTKADLVEDAPDVAADVVAAAPGVAVHVVSSRTGEGLDSLRARLEPGHTVALLGQSGVGKSTLVNALAGWDVVTTGPVGTNGKGRHVTTARELVRLPSGVLLLDTPGLRGVGLVATDEGLEPTFPEIDELAQDCRFGDCSHQSEPGCAVLAAVESGELPLRRVESWRKLIREVEWMARRGDARLMSEERKKWKQIHLSVRRSGVTRG